ncbi:MAG: hypothetical protein IKR48_12920 [Kiritimatiellae bacterium]|nr:hypothetical protein [Kiritimatiellia bacterium]
MALSINSIRNYTGTESIMLDQQRTGIEGSKLQRFRSFFNIGNARQKNAETLTVIHHAILNDPSFAAPEVQAEAARLLSQVRTDRAIGATQIKSIVQSLDNLMQNTQASVENRVKLRLASTMPPWAAGYEEKVIKVASIHVLKGLSTAGSYTAIDVAGRTQEALARIHAALTYAGDNPDLREIVLSTLDRTMIGLGATLATDQKIQQRIDTFRTDLERIDARAQRSANPAEVKKLGVAFLISLGKPVHPDVIDTLDTFSQSLPTKALATLKPTSTASEIIRAIHRFAETIRTVMIQYPEGVEPLNGGDEIAPTQEFVIKRAIAELPAAAQDNLLHLLESEVGIDACAYISSQTSSGRAIGDFNAVSYTVEYLQQRAGKPTGYPGGYDAVAKVYDYSPLARCAFTPEHAFSGSASEPIKTALLRPHHFGRFNFPAAAMHDKIDAAAKSMVTCTFAAEMKKLATGVNEVIFDKDIKRNTVVTLPDGTQVSNDPAVARDQFARLVTGNDQATYDTLLPAEKAKANAFMALLSQETEKAVEKGIPTALSRTGSTAAFSCATDARTDAPQPVRSFDISGSPLEGFTIHYRGDFPTLFMMYDDENGVQQQTEMGQKIVCKYEMEMHISQASLNQMSLTDWATYDPTVSDGILNELDHPNRLADSYNAIPPNFRLDVDVTAGFIIHADAAPKRRH